MSTPSVRDLFVLGRVSEGPTYGHEIMKTIETSRADLWLEISEKHVYYVLKKLERDGLVSSEPGGDGRSRTVYRITTPGRGTLKSWLADETLVAGPDYSDFAVVFAMLAYTDALGDEARTAVLRQRLAELDRRLADEYPALMGKHIQKRFGRAARALYDKGRIATGAERAWLAGLIEEVEAHGWAGFEVTEDEEPAEAPDGRRGVVRRG